MQPMSTAAPISAPCSPCWYTRNFYFFSLMQPMSPIAPNSAPCRKPTGAYRRKTWCIVAAVKWYVFVVPSPPPPQGAPLAQPTKGKGREGVW